MPRVLARGSQVHPQPELHGDTLQCSSPRKTSPVFTELGYKVDYDKPKTDTQLSKYVTANPFETSTQEINSESRHLKENRLFCGATVKNHHRLWIVLFLVIFMFSQLSQVILTHRAEVLQREGI